MGIYSDSFLLPRVRKRRMRTTMDKIKKIAMIFLGCTAGSVLIQLAAPMILAALISAAALAVPFLLYHLMVEKGWRIRLVTEKTGEKEQENDAGEPEDMPEYSEENDRPVQAETKESQTRSVQEEAVSFWYSERGKKQLDRIVASLYSRGIYECWIRKDGICNFRTDQGYRRAGIFPGYPGANSGLVAKLLRGEGLNATDQGKYLHIVWTEE